MKKELSRQLIHLSVFLFVILAQYVGRWLTSFYLLIIALTLFIYSQYIMREEKKLSRLLHRMEKQFRELATGLERKEVIRPFTGAIWLFFSAGLAFLLFPLPVASAAVIIVTVGDGFSTLIGRKFGRHRILGRKTLEGSIAMFIFSLSAVLFVSLVPVLAGSLTATLGELVPHHKKLRQWEKRGWLNDNFLVPVLSGAVIYLVVTFL